MGWRKCSWLASGTGRLASVEKRRLESCTGEGERGGIRQPTGSEASQGLAQGTTLKIRLIERPVGGEGEGGSGYF